MTTQDRVGKMTHELYLTRIVGKLTLPGSDLNTCCQLVVNMEYGFILAIVFGPVGHGTSGATRGPWVASCCQHYGRSRE